MSSIGFDYMLYISLSGTVILSILSFLCYIDIEAFKLNKRNNVHCGNAVLISTLVFIINSGLFVFLYHTHYNA